MVVQKSVEMANLTGLVLVFNLELLDSGDLGGLKIFRLAHPGNEARFPRRNSADLVVVDFVFF